MHVKEMTKRWNIQQKDKKEKKQQIQINLKNFISKWEGRNKTDDRSGVGEERRLFDFVVYFSLKKGTFLIIQL